MAKLLLLADDHAVVPLPADELEERGADLRALLLRGALRLARREFPGPSAPTEVDPAEVIQK